jgi:hypothetical protein
MVRITLANEALQDEYGHFFTAHIPKVGDKVTVDCLELEPVTSREFVIEDNELIEVILYTKAKTGEVLDGQK